MLRFLVVECIAGFNYSLEDLRQIKEKIEELMNTTDHIESEKLPLLKQKKHSDKVLCNVSYSIDGTICRYITL